FAFRRKASRLMVERWGLANIALQGVTVRDWFLGREAQRLSRFKFKVEEIPWRGHPVLRLAGRERLLPAAARAAQGLASLSLPAPHFRGYVWHCPQSNKVFALTGQERRREDVVEDVFGRMVCH